ncbi:MAG TPA: NAD+ synthase [Longimicrobiales bacterium]|nr:NAD+ synthase [Longimicrobiales bacterium]
MLRVALAQMNVTVGDLTGNAAGIARRIEEARDAGAHIVAFPELAITGYPPEDLLLKPSFIDANRKALLDLQAKTKGITAIIGFVERETDLYNAAAILHDGEWIDTYRKQRLPNYGVFDELRYFSPGSGEVMLSLGGATVGVSVCEDIWSPGGPVGRLASAGADLIVNINASPFHRDKSEARHRMLGQRAADYGIALAYVNMVGGQDELVFDGDSVVLDATGHILAEAQPFADQLLLCDVELEQVFRARLHDPRRRQNPRRAQRSIRTHVLSTKALEIKKPIPKFPPVDHHEVAEVYKALVMGTGDYARKNGFKQCVIGLSGGVDSSLVAAIAVDALGAACVRGVSMPSQYSSEHSRTDAAALADALGIEMITLPIKDIFDTSVDTLAPAFTGRAADLAEENLQARIRGNLLMALSNKFGYLVLTTGNKSEMATGYSTLYGDMAGGFAVLKDVPKTLVYELCRWRNERGGARVIPENVLTKAPSAELRPNQKDQDSLPPYDVLDPILERYVELDWSVEEIIEAGYEADVVSKVVALVDRNEYKRRQSPPGVKITARAFGKDRRLPITNRYRG